MCVCIQGRRVVGVLSSTNKKGGALKLVYNLSIWKAKHGMMTGKKCPRRRWRQRRRGVISRKTGGAFSRPANTFRQWRDSIKKSIRHKCVKYGLN